MLMEIDSASGGDNALPKKVVLPDRQKSEQIVRPIRSEKVKTNCYAIKFSSPITLCHYDAKFFCITDRGVKDLSQGMKTDVGNELRRNFLWALFNQMLESNPEHFPVEKQNIVYDCGCMIVSTKKLPINEEGIKITLSESALKQDDRVYLPAQVKELEIRVDSYFLENGTANEEADRSLLQLLDIVYNQKIIDGNEFHVFPHKSFIKKADPRNHIDGRIIKDGLAKGVRICSDDADKVGLMLQVEIVRSAFFPSGFLLDYLIQRFNCRDSRDLENIFKNRHDAKKISSELKRLTLVTTHLKKNRAFICDELDEKHALEREFYVETKHPGGGTIEKQKFTVADYFDKKYNLRLKCRYMPCVIQKTPGADGPRFLFFPIDVLKIVDGQRVPVTKMTPKFQDTMIKNTRMNPEQLDRVTDNVLHTAVLNSRNPYAHAFNVPMGSSAIETQADILPQPAILYKDNVREEPDQDGKLLWRPPQNRKFLIAGRLNKWMVVKFDSSIEDQVLNRFGELFVQKLKERGVQIDNVPILVASNCWEGIRKEAVNQHVDFLLVITKEKMDPVHNSMKHFEINSKIVTQHLWIQTVCNIVKKNQFITMENIVMKTNEKLGGTNFMVTSSSAFNQAVSAESRGILEAKWLGDNRLFIGLDLSHSHSGASAQNVKSVPSVVGMSYNVDEKLSMTGHYFFRTPNKTIITDLAEEFETPILEYKERSMSKQWPSHIFIYRSGVSESEYSQVARVEKTALLNCFGGLAIKYPDFKKPGFTFVIAQRNNGFKLTPTQEPAPNRSGKITDADRNLKPGTLVSKGVVNPALEQFILVAHRTIQGTARPILYTVVADEDSQGTGKRIPTDELKYLTFALCHLHNNVLGTVNVPSVLYHAGQVAKRGRNNMKMEVFGTVDESSTSISNNVRRIGQTDQEYEAELTRILRVSLRSKYWA